MYEVCTAMSRVHYCMQSTALRVYSGAYYFIVVVSTIACVSAACCVCCCAAALLHAVFECMLRASDHINFSFLLHIPWVAAYTRWLPRMLKLHDRFPVEMTLHQFIPCTRDYGSTAHEGGTSQLDLLSLRPLSSWLWSTATTSSQLGYFSILLQVVDNWPHILW